VGQRLDDDRPVRRGQTAEVVRVAGLHNPAPCFDRDAFTSGTSLGLRVGTVLLLVATAVVAHQHPPEQES
jgi:hypothetical protein